MTKFKMQIEIIRLNFKALIANIKGEYYLSQGYKYRAEMLIDELRGEE